MKKRIAGFLAVAIAAFGSRADTWTDPDTGYTWSYQINGDTSEIYTGYYSAAIMPSPTGTVTIPSMLGGKPMTSIGDYAFNGCSGLTSVTIPNSVTNIGDYAFYVCSGLTNITVSADNTMYLSVDGLLLSKDGTVLIQGVNRNVKIPDGVTRIGRCAFLGCRDLTSVTIPDSVTSIGSAAFEGCVGLATLYVPNTVNNVGAWSFAGCTNLTSVTMPQCLCTGGEQYNNQLREVCDAETWNAITAVTIADGVGEIGRNAFRNWENLRSCTISGSVTNIEASAFSGCSGLTNLVLGAGIVNISDYAFADCVSLPNVVIPDSTTFIGNSAFERCAELTELEIGKSVTNIGYSAFHDCSGLGNVVIPDSVLRVGSEAFYGCNALTCVTVPRCLCIDAEEVWAGDFRESIFSRVFDVSTVNIVIISKSVNRIGTRMFYNCSNLREVYIPDGVLSIGTEAFSGCSGLSSLIMPDSVVRIERRAFSGCSGLTRLTIPDAVTSIGDAAFSGCSGLIYVAIPQVICNGKLSSWFSEAYQSIKTVLVQPTVTSSWNSWSSDVFGGCTNVSNVIFCGPLPPRANYSLARLNPTAKISFPEEHTCDYAKVVKADQFDGYIYRDLKSFVTGGDREWIEDVYTSNANDKSFCSGMVSNNEYSWIETTISGPGRLSFWWKASTETYDEAVFDYAFLSVDGIPKGRLTDAYKLEGVAIGGETDWTNVVIDVVGDGSHTIRWTYSKDYIDETDVGADCAWLDWFAFHPKPKISFDIGEYAVGSSPDAIQEFSVSRVALPQDDGFSWENYVFDGWSDGASIYRTGSEYIVPSTNVMLTAHWIRKSFVSFDIDIAEGEAPETMKVLPGVSITLPSAECFALPDHVFDGWIYDGTVYKTGESFKVGSTDVTFSVKWLVKTFMSFDVGNGEGVVPELIKALPSTIVTLPTGDGFSWVDHVFDGWTDGTKNYGCLGKCDTKDGGLSRSSLRKAA